VSQKILTIRRDQATATRRETGTGAANVAAAKNEKPAAAHIAGAKPAAKACGAVNPPLRSKTVTSNATPKMPPRYRSDETVGLGVTVGAGESFGGRVTSA
jgi:hypothetical protein